MRHRALQALRSKRQSLRKRCASSSRLRAVGRVVVSGMLAEQLARELSDGARPRSVPSATASGPARGGRCGAGDRRRAERRGRRPRGPRRPDRHPRRDRAVLAAGRLASALRAFAVRRRVPDRRRLPGTRDRRPDHGGGREPAALAARVPVLADQAESAVIRSAVARSALLRAHRRPGPAGHRARAAAPGRAAADARRPSPSPTRPRSSPAPSPRRSSRATASAASPVAHGACSRRRSPTRSSRPPARRSRSRTPCVLRARL